MVAVISADLQCLNYWHYFRLLIHPQSHLNLITACELALLIFAEDLVGVPWLNCQHQLTKPHSFALSISSSRKWILKASLITIIRGSCLKIQKQNSSFARVTMPCRSAFSVEKFTSPTLGFP